MPGDIPTIVLVDDAAEVRLLLRTRLRLSGALDVVAEGADGRDAVELAREHQPTLMLLDVSMPVMDGLSALHEVLKVAPETRVVLYTGFEERGLARQALDAGAAAYVEKSVGTDALVERLLALVEPDAAQPRRPAATSRTPEEGLADRVDHGVLAEHLERFREVFDQAAIGMATMTLAGNLVRANAALATLLGRRDDDLVGVHYGSLIDGDATVFDEVMEQIRVEPVDVRVLEHAVRTDVGRRTVRVTFAPVRDSAGRPLYNFLQVQDVTVERAALEELRQSEERFRLLVEAVDEYAIFMLDPTGHIVSWNAGAQRAKGYAAEEIIGQHFRVFYPPEVAARKHPEHELELAVRDGHYEEEGWRVRKDGSTFWANVVITAVFDPTGRHLGFAKVTRDNSERRRLEQQLQQAVEDQSQFLAVTAHELRTPIGVLGGSAQTLARHWEQLTGEERGELFDAMETSTARLKRLLADLLTVSRLQSSRLEVETERVVLDELLTEILAGIRHGTPGVDVELDCPPGLAVLGDRVRLSQMVENLVANALRHGSPPVHVAVEEQGDHLEIRVTDQGTGVAPDVRPRLFERFATGAGAGGTGLGLYIVRQLAQAHGGDATYEVPDAGGPGAFVIRLPVAGDATGPVVVSALPEF